MEDSNLVALFKYPSASFALQFDDFAPRDRSAAKGTFPAHVIDDMLA